MDVAARRRPVAGIMAKTYHMLLSHQKNSD